ncbi:lysozyme inhibitor LprI family protein [Hyphomicrobium sp. 99]|uniref:lysozyme inhibitor LprI family protein n=1 Tax=Hyphomicrobium sp. 99 TaxID=1163419 RepID=UPI0005F7E5D4|nr:lysozyme inhibitor LprI family protein [Hyphomicrobium sp. 99]
MIRRAAHVPCLLLYLGLANVWTTGPARAEIDCANAVSTVEMNFCADKDYQAADKALNAAYANAVASIRTGGDQEKPYDVASFLEAMRKAQRAWVAYRDADCKELVAQEWSGGSGTSSAILGCMTEKTIQRTKELRERYRQQ